MNAKRLQKLADYLKTVPRKNFDYRRVGRKDACGTIGCAMGHAATVFPRLIKLCHGNMMSTIQLKDVIQFTSSDDQLSAAIILDCRHAIKHYENL